VHNFWLECCWETQSGCRVPKWFWSSEIQQNLEALLSHSSIKRVTPQRQVFRTLKYVNDTEDISREFPRFTGRSSLALVGFSNQYYLVQILNNSPYRVTLFGILPVATVVAVYLELFLVKSLQYFKQMLCGTWVSLVWVLFYLKEYSFLTLFF